MKLLSTFLLSAFCFTAAADPLEHYNTNVCVPFELNGSSEFPDFYCRNIPQWYLKNTGETSHRWKNGVYDFGVEPGGNTDAGIWLAWQKQPNANGVIVGVIDSGCDDTHQDLAGVVLGGVYISDRGTPVMTEGQYQDFDPWAHGTGGVSIIAAKRNGIGMVGVAPGAKVLVVATPRSFPELTDGHVAKGIIWLVDRGAQIICTSYGESYSQSDDLFDAMVYAQLNNVIIVSAVRYGGSLEDAPSYPYTWNFPNYVAVTATTRTGVRYGVSAYGARVVGAPGLRIVKAGFNNSYNYGDGQSFSSPIVAGLLALMIACDPGQPAWRYVQTLKNNAANYPLAGCVGRVNGSELEK